MKLRFHDDSLRLRLSRSDIAHLAQTGRVEETVTFAPGQSISYLLESAPEPAVTATFTANRIRVALPSAAAKQWIESDQVGIEGDTATLHLLIEKDFECLHQASTEVEDAFPNPLANKG